MIQPSAQDNKITWLWSVSYYEAKANIRAWVSRI